MNDARSALLLALLAACAILIFTPLSAIAHHGWADFDASSELTLHGVVVDFHYVNPHSVVEFTATDEKGQTRQWQGEFGSPNELARKGWSQTSLNAGDKITITGHPAKNGVPALHVSSITLANGQEVKLYGGR